MSDHEHHLIINAKFYSSTMIIMYTMSLANMSAAPQKSYSQQHYFQILSTFPYNFGIGHWLANLGCQLMKHIEV